jgi:hypothetical protein
MSTAEKTMNGHRSPVTMRIGIFLPGLVLAVFATSCDPGHAREVGITVNPASEIEVYFNPCNPGPKDRVTSLRLYAVKGSIGGDEDDTLLWSIASAEGSKARTFTIGRVPEGFSEVSPLLDASSDARLRIFLTTLRAAAIEASIGFTRNELRADKVLTSGDRYKPIGDFMAKEPC